MLVCVFSLQNLYCLSGLFERSWVTWAFAFSCEILKCSSWCVRLVGDASSFVFLAKDFRNLVVSWTKSLDGYDHSLLRTLTQQGLFFSGSISEKHFTFGNTYPNLTPFKKCTELKELYYSNPLFFRLYYYLTPTGSFHVTLYIYYSCQQLDIAALLSVSLEIGCKPPTFL